MEENILTTTKKCTKCGEEKDISEFYKAKRSGDRLQSYCKDCCKKTNKEYLSRPEIHARESKRWKMYKNTKYANQACELIKKHHEEMKNDPDHLPTEFIQILMGRKCPN